jgi:hypothetical protein
MQATPEAVAQFIRADLEPLGLAKKHQVWKCKVFFFYVRLCQDSPYNGDSPSSINA